MINPYIEFANINKLKKNYSEMLILNNIILSKLIHYLFVNNNYSFFFKKTTGFKVCLFDIATIFIFLHFIIPIILQLVTSIDNKRSKVIDAQIAVSISMFPILVFIMLCILLSVTVYVYSYFNNVDIKFLVLKDIFDHSVDSFAISLYGIFIWSFILLCVYWSELISISFIKSFIFSLIAVCFPMFLLKILV